MTMASFMHTNTMFGCVQSSSASVYGLTQLIPALKLKTSKSIATSCRHCFASASVLQPLEAPRNAAELALELLEWPRVLNIVSSFAGTSSARARIQEFDIPSSQVECEELLSKTSAAVDLLALLGSALDFGGIQTELVKACLIRLQKGFVISGVEAQAIAVFFQFTDMIRYDLKTSKEQTMGSLDALSSFLDMICTVGSQPGILKAIEKVIDEDGKVKDTASPDLQKARIQYHSEEAKVQELLRSMIMEQEGSASIEEVEGRYCIVLSADHEEAVQGLLLRSGGSKSYVEPVSVVPLNDKLGEARAAAIKAEYEALKILTNKIVPYVDDMTMLLDIIIELDMIIARAKFSSVYKGSRPVFTTHQDTCLGSFSMEKRWDISSHPSQDLEILLRLKRAYHPLLLHQHQEQRQDIKHVAGRQKKKVAGPCGHLPVPIDVIVQEPTRVVTISGPNTGGKTAAMKTVGLAALMAKSGLYVLAAHPVYLPWFDAVFADIGDEQSLHHSLSTFSGHVNRINQIKDLSTKNSLVLIDEVGTGTNPSEGAALGMSILESFARDGRGSARLTFASTHHAELKTLKYSDSRFENASVEFDEETLKPTYRLLWGIPGRSNALNISEKLGMPKEILFAAKNYLGAGTAEINQVIMDLERLKKEFESSVSNANEYLKKSKILYGNLRRAVEHLQDELKSLYTSAYYALQAAARKARSSLSAVNQKTLHTMESTSSMEIEASVKAPSYTTSDTTNANTERTILQGGTLPLKVGEMVYVPALGKQAAVVEVLSGKRMVIVQSGPIQLRLKFSDFQR